MDLSKLDSATKYPSIENYHALGERGVLTDEVTDLADVEKIYTEKVDGTNGRMVFMPSGDYFIGSRDALVYAKGDRVINPVQGIVAALKPVADRIVDLTGFRDTFFSSGQSALVVYAEVYGHKIGAAAGQYTKDGNVGVRMFDACTVDLTLVNQARDTAEVATLRDHGGNQRWLSEFRLTDLSSPSVSNVPLTPRLKATTELPTDHAEVLAWMDQLLPQTRVALDEGHVGEPEGIVVRTKDRKVIRKLRLAEYRKTLDPSWKNKKGR